MEQKIKKLRLEIPISLKTEILKQNVKIKERTIPNRLSIQPMEGFDSNLDGSPGKLTFRRYKRYAKGGAGLIWFEATAISENGRSNPHQLIISEKTLNKFKELVSVVRAISNNTLKELGFKKKCWLILQLNHSGRYCRREGKKYPIRAFHNIDLDEAIGVSKKDGIVISDEELENLEEIWVNKAILAKEIGFDGVDIKSSHGYLISELLSSRARYNSKYGGGSLENRACFFLNIIKKLMKELKNDSYFFITTRMSVYDGIPFPNGFGVKSKENEVFPASIDLTEPIELIKILHDNGIRLINISAGNPHYKPQITRPHDTPVKGGSLPNEHPLYGVNRILNLASEIKSQIPKDMIVIGSGFSYLRQFAGNVAAGLVHQKKVDICGFGRMAFANPDFPKQIFQDGIIDKNKTCITCSQCSQFMKLGLNTGCAIRDPQYHKKSIKSE
ncbi:MAG: oxidoreductase [Promethearchaeota archaeon]